MRYEVGRRRLPLRYEARVYIGRRSPTSKACKTSVANDCSQAFMTECSSVWLGTLVPFTVYIDEIATDVTSTFIEILISL